MCGLWGRVYCRYFFVNEEDGEAGEDGVVSSTFSLLLLLLYVSSRTGIVFIVTGRAKFTQVGGEEEGDQTGGFLFLVPACLSITPSRVPPTSFSSD